MSKDKTDIMIIGGGIAGCIAAISLAPSYSVTLIDKLLEPKDRIGESLAPAANRILAELDLLELLESLSPPIFKQNLGMKSYWGSDQLRFVDHLNNPDGFVKSLDRRAFEQFLREEALNRGVDCIWGSALKNSSFDSVKQEWSIELRSSAEEDKTGQFSAQFVIDASGRQSHFARSIGIQRYVHDKLIACWITTPNTEENTMSTIYSSPNGWWYSSVLPNDKRIIAFHTDSDLIDKKDLKSTDAFLRLIKESEAMQQLFSAVNYDIEFNGTTAANSTKLNQVAGRQWAAIGDAAISFDPLSSQGIFNAMASAMQLRDLILNQGLKAQISNTYSAQIDQIWTHYLKHRTLFYNSEKRWKTPFWTRRL